MTIAYLFVNQQGEKCDYGSLKNFHLIDFQLHS